MNVTVSVFGRFHAFYLARELDRRGHLEALITSYPKFETSRWGVPRDEVVSLWPLEAGRRVVKRLPLVPRFNRQLHGGYERMSARHIPESTDLFVGWSGTAAQAIQRARELSAATVVERCSSHIRTQRAILREEYERNGVEPVLPSPWVVEKEEWEYEAADRVAIPSSFVARTFREQGFSADRLLKIPYGVDPEEFEPVEKEDDVFRAVFAGQLAHRKGVHYLLQAWRDLDLPGSELLLLGPVRKAFEPWLERFAGSYRHPGNLPQRELYRWYSQGSVFVLPSVEEGMAYVQLQAMACGLPLICTPNTGGEDLIRAGKEGFVVPIRDVDALTERLLWCYENQETCREMGWNARQRVLRNFTWRDYGRRAVHAYSNLLTEDQ